MCFYLHLYKPMVCKGDLKVLHPVVFHLTGGVRGAAFVHSPLLASKGRVSMDLMHVTDWLPTLYEVAGGDSSKLHNLDGYNMWDTLSKGKDSPRLELLHNIHTNGGAAAMRYGQWKIVVNAGKCGKGVILAELIR